jgi:hypothetical protein
VSADAVVERLDEVLDDAVPVEQAFAAQLSAQRPEHRRVLLAALRSACGDDHRRRLAQRGLDDDAVRASVARTVRALLNA